MMGVKLTMTLLVALRLYQSEQLPIERLLSSVVRLELAGLVYQNQPGYYQSKQSS